MSRETELRPAVINAKIVFRFGTTLWAAALGVLAFLHFTGTSVPGRYPVIAGVGIALGALGYWWAHRNHLIGDDGISQPQEPHSSH